MEQPTCASQSGGETPLLVICLVAVAVAVVTGTVIGWVMQGAVSRYDNGSLHDTTQL